MADDDAAEQLDGESPTLASAIRQAREAAGLSIRQLAALVGINYSVLSRIEAGQVTRPSAEVLQNMADVLELDATELLAFIGVKATLPEPRVYFRRAYGMTEDEAEEAASIIADLRAKRHRSSDGN